MSKQLPADFENCIKALESQEGFESWINPLEEILSNNLQILKHGDLPLWQEAVSRLPDAQHETHFSLGDTITIGQAGALNTEQTRNLETQLHKLCPWRKGPFDFFGIHIDTEWRSDWKWQRLQNGIASLEGKRVLDVGCGSGYHLWRMREAGATFVLGIDPSLLFWQQFLCAKKYLNQEPVYFLPLRSEDLPERLSAFDTVFSMGVLYHRRSPLDHLIELRNALIPGGQLVLETLVVDEQGPYVLFPKDRYAQMRNVFFLPSIELLISWLERMGFEKPEIVDINQTSTEEQRVTPWVKAKSLKDFLDPKDQTRTIEGYPAPLRAIISAIKSPRFQ